MRHTSWKLRNIGNISLVFIAPKNNNFVFVHCLAISAPKRFFTAEHTENAEKNVN